MKKGFWKKGVSLFLCTVFMTGAMTALQPVQAAPYTLLLSQAKSIALTNSDSYRRIKSKIALKEVSYKQAVKSIQLKIKNKTTFRWSPLLSFKFPEKLNFEDESSMVYKPAQIESEISSLKHSLTNEVYSVYESTAQAYVKAYTLQEKVAFEERQLETLKETLNKNRGRLLLGIASQADIDAMEKNIKAAEEKLAADMKNLENAKTKLGDLLHMDVTTKYTFVNPYVDAEIPRTELDALVEYTLENDQSYYEAKMTTTLSMLQLETNYNLIKKQYGSKVGQINSYVQTVMKGETIDGDAFKASYDKFLEEIDKPWQGKKKILFIKIPKEWFKGEIDGVRYIEDEPYALYENALDYQDALAEQEELAKELKTQVEESFESVATARTAYLNLKASVAEQKAQLQKELVLNKLGELTFEEYTESQKQYEEQQIKLLEALETYTSLVYAFDKLTCGAVSQYLKDLGISLDGSDGGQSYIVDEETVEGARYYIKSIVEDNMFEFGIYLPEDFETDITHYELWVDNYVVGERTAIDKTIRHLTLSLTEDERVFVRLYNGDDFVDDCEIDPTAYQGPLNITGYTIKKREEALKREIGKYEIKSLDEMGLVEISLTINGVEEIQYYAIQNEAGTNLLAADAKPITDSFTYLNFLSKDIDRLQIRCLDASKNEKYIAYFDTLKQTIYMIEEE